MSKPQLFLSRLTLDPRSRLVQRDLAAPYEMHRTLCHAFPGLSDDEWQAARVLFRVDDDNVDDDNGRLSLLVQSKTEPHWGAFINALDGRYLSQDAQCKSWEPHFEDEQTLRFRLQANPTYSPIIAGAFRKKGRFKSKRVGLYREAERLDWLRRQGERLGFELDFPLDQNGELVPTRLSSHVVERNGKTETLLAAFREQRADRIEVVLPICEVIDLNAGRAERDKDSKHSDDLQRSRRASMPLGEKPDGQRKHRFGSSEFSAALFNGILRVTDAGKFADAVANGIGPAKGFGFGLLSVAPLTK